MNEMHYIIDSVGLIPEVIGFETKELAMKYWHDRFGELQEDNDGNNPDDSFAIGFANWHDTELRHGVFELSEVKELKLTHRQTGLRNQMSANLALLLDIQQFIENQPNDQLLGKAIRELWRVLP